MNDLRPFRPDTVGKPVRGMEIRIAEPDADGIGEVAVRSKTVMSHYLDDPEMTAETIVNGWLMTGDLGRVDATGQLQLFGRKKNMIVTAEGKNIYPEDIENDFEGIAVKEFCVFAANYIWPQRTMTGEQLVLVLHPEPGHTVDDALVKELSRRNAQLLNYKRVCGYIVVGPGFSAHRLDENQARRPCRADRQATRPQRDGPPVNEAYFTIVNPAAGGGRCGKLAARALDRLRAAGLPLEVRETRAPGEATVLAHGAYADGYRKFIAVGGDGTGFEIVNGIFPGRCYRRAEPRWDFFRSEPEIPFFAISRNGQDLAEFGIHAILERRRVPATSFAWTTRAARIFYINTLNMGFAADVATLTNRHLKFLGELGYLAGVLVSLARLRRRPFPLRADGERDDRRCLFVAFSNSKYTGGKMMIAPQASIDSGTIEYVHWGPIGRIGLVRNLPTLFDG